MIRMFSFAALAVLGCTAASAAVDKRVRSLAYEPDHIVQVLGRTGIQSTIQFGPDERIQNVAVGDSSKWEITPNHGATLLFVKPLAPRVRTNMTVVTDRRTYMFDLVAGDKWTTPVYVMKFSYPNDKSTVDPTTVSTGKQVQVAAATPATTADRLHFDWKSKGSHKLIPSRVFDDGTSVYLSWNRETPLPALLTVSDDRKEGPLSYRMSGEYIVVSPIPQNMVLRYENQMALLWTTRRIVQPQHAAPAAQPAEVAQRIATAAAAQPVTVQPAEARTNVAGSQSSTVKLANMTTLFTDRLTDGRQ